MIENWREGHWQKTRSCAVCCYRSNVHWRVNMKQSGCSRAGNPLATRRSGEGIHQLSYFASNYNFPANFLSANTRAIANSVYHQNVVSRRIGQEFVKTKWNIDKSKKDPGCCFFNFSWSEKKYGHHWGHLLLGLFKDKCQGEGYGMVEVKKLKLWLITFLNSSLLTPTLLSKRENIQMSNWTMNMGIGHHGQSSLNQCLNVFPILLKLKQKKAEHEILRSFSTPASARSHLPVLVWIV